MCLHADSSERTDVLYAPEVVFRTQPLTFRVQVPEGQKLVVTTNQVALALPALPLKSEPVEFTVFPEKPYTLTVGSADKVDWTFHLLKPGFSGKLTERDGFLEQNGEAVILMPDHLLPPPLDRRWETLRLIREDIFNGKPAIDKITWLIPKDSPLTSLNPKLSSGTAERVSPNESFWFRLHGLMAAVEKKPADFVALEVDLHDVERGVPLHIWLMKWQFLLQHVHQQTGYNDGLLFGPVFEDPQGEAAVWITEQLRSLALANGLRYIDRALPSEEWEKRMLHQVAREYILP
jgi:hypothetical protein